RSPRARPRFAGRPTSWPTACARGLRGRSPPSPRTCKSPRWSAPGRRRPTRAPSPPPPRPWREKPREDDRGAPRFIRGAPSVGGVEARPDSFGARRVWGGRGAPRATPGDGGGGGGAGRGGGGWGRGPIHSGRDEGWGVWGAISGPPNIRTRVRRARR